MRVSSTTVSGVTTVLHVHDSPAANIQCQMDQNQRRLLYPSVTMSQTPGDGANTTGHCKVVPQPHAKSASLGEQSLRLFCSSQGLNRNLKLQNQKLLPAKSPLAYAEGLARPRLSAVIRSELGVEFVAGEGPLIHRSQWAALRHYV